MGRRPTPPILAALACALGVLLLSCAPAATQRTYSVYEAGQPMAVRYGVVDSVRPVKLQSPPTGAGAAAGSTVGAMAGAAIASNNSSCYNGSGVWWVGAVGALLGGLIGSAIEADASQRDGLELRLQMDDGETLVVVQEAHETFRVGDAVEVVTAPDGSARVRHAPY